MSKSEVADNIGPEGVNDKQLQRCSLQKFLTIFDTPVFQ